MPDARYPPNWPEISYSLRSERAKWRCEQCGAEHASRYPGSRGRVILAVHHLGIPYPDGRPGNKQDKGDCRPENLIVVCQRCHLSLDRGIHTVARLRTALARRRAKWAALGYEQLEMVF